MRNQNSRSLSRKGRFSLVALVWVFAIGICLQTFLAPAVRAGSITREVFNGITGTLVSDLTNNPAYPASPTSTNLVTDFFESPTDVFEDYGQRMHGYIVPPVSGNYTFWIATDDGGALFLSTDEKPANMKQIAAVPGWVASRNWNGYVEQQSAPIALQSGKAYYVSALMKEGGGGDNLAVRWLRPDGLDEGPIPATYLLPWGTSFTPPQISQQPADTTVVEGQMANFTVKVSNLDAVSCQWFKGASAISGATSQTLTYGPVTLGDEGATFRATLTNKLGSTNSATATLHVTPDTAPPTITQVINQSTTSLLVTFSEAVDASAASFQLNNGVTVNFSSPGTDPRTVVLTTSAMVMGSTYTLTVNNVKDRAGAPNTIAPNSQISFIALEFVSQNIGGTGGVLNRVADGQFDVVGAGKDIGGTADHFQYAWQLRSGDFDLQVRLRDVKITDSFVHAGLMARATLETNSQFAAAFASSAAVGSFFESRATAGATAASSAAGAFPANYPQAWLRLKRVGNVFTGYGSLDGISWVQLGTATVTMPTQVYFGLALSSESATQTSYAQFRDFGTTVSTATGAAYKPEHEPLAPSSRGTGLVFSEVMYHAKADARFQNELEYIEIYNADDIFEDLSGYQLSGGVTYKFPNGYILPAGAFVVIALDPIAVRTAYGVTNVLGPYTGKLDNGGDTIELRDGFAALKLELEYKDTAPWPVAADGAGHSIVLTRPSYGEGDPRAWSASSQIGGSPGRDDLIVANPQKEVWINEFLANSDGIQQPFVELYNHNTTSVDISGCYITDSATTNKYRIANGTSIPARGYLSFTASQLGFTINGAGGALYLVSSNALRVIDAIAFSGQEAGISTGRSPDGSATIRRLSLPTPGAANAQWKVEDLVINEIMYAPISGNKDEQYVELYNRSGSTINLANWRLNDGIDFTFPAGASVAAGGYVVVARNRDLLLANYANLNVNNTFGNFTKSLNKSDHLELSKTGTFVTTNQSSQLVTNGIRITTMEVAYVGGGRWTKYSKEGGSSLELIDPRGDVLRSSNWADSDESQKGQWTTNTFTGVLDNGNGSYPPDRLYVFMQDGGECLIDEIEVIKSGTAVNSVANGTFDAGSTGWTFFGDHSRSTVDATGGLNNSGVLHLRADDKGMQGINSVQAALTGLVSGNTATIRAKTRWIAGYPEVLLRTRGGWIELPVRMSIPKNLGTPGAANSRLRPTQNAGPAIYDVSHAPLLPRANNIVTVSCKVSDPDGIGPVTLQYRVDPNAGYTSVTMRDDGTGGDTLAGDGIYSGNIPGQAAGALVGFKITASDINPASPATTTFPAGNMWQIALPGPECYVRWGDPLPSGTFAYYYLWNSQASEAQRNNALNNTYRDATLVYNTWRVIYNCGFRDKGSPYHGGAGSFAVMNPDDEPLLGETDRIFRSTGNGGADGIPVRNRLTAWMGRKMAIPYLNSHYMQLFRNGSQFANVTQDEEYPGVGYSKQWFPDGSNGDVYKIAVWFEFANDNSSFGATGSTLESFKSGPDYKLARYRWNWNTRGFMGSANNYTNIFNLVAAANDTSTNFVKNVLNIADVEEWMRVFAYDRVLGNWDSWTYNVGQNMFAVKQAGLPWQLMPWDIDFTLGAGDGPTTGLMNGGQDPVMNTWFNTPAFRRMFWRGYQKALAGALDPAQYTPVGDALQAAMVRNNISGAGSPTALYSYMAQRRSFIVSQIAANDVTSFTITRNNGAPYTSTTPTTVLTGKAPFAVVSIAVNGTPYPAVWTDQNSWSINVPLAAGQNVLNVRGVDANGVLVPGNTASITVTYTGVAQQPQDYVVINEVHYNSAEPDASFIELYNNSTTTPFDLSGFRMNGVGYTFPDGSIIQPNQFALLVGHRAGFALAYGQTIPVMGEFAGNLDHSGEQLSLVKPLGLGGTNDLIISDVRYGSSAPWPTNANGFGPSLQLIDPTKGSYRVANWATTANNDPNRVTPGRTNLVKSTIAAFPTLWINEVLPNNINGPLDNAGEHEPFIELYNSGATSVSLGGLYLSDDYANLTKWALPLATIGSKQFLRIWADGQTAQSTASDLHAPFRLNPTNGSVALSRMQTTPAVLDYIDYVRITPDRSFGSYPDGEPRNRRLFSNVTPGAANDPTLPPANVVINEFMASNTSTLVDPATGQYEDWFELYNAGANDVDLTSFTLTSALTNVTEFRIPPGYILPAGKFLLVWADSTTKSNQVSDPALHTSFKLTKLGGDIGLFDPDGKLIDGFTYGEQTNDVSMGHFPDGDTGLQVTFDIPTPGTANVLSGANQAPVLTAIPDKSVAEQTTLQFTATATDPDAGQTIQYSLGVGAPAGAAIDATTGAFTWTPTEQQGPGSYGVTVIATDNGTPARTATRSLTVTVTEANRQPTLDPLANATIDDSTLFAFTATASDPDVPANGLTFSLLAGAPAGAAIDPLTGRFTWTPTPAQAGTWPITVKVTDNGSPALSDQKSFQLTVRVVEHAPVIDPVSQQFLNEGSSLNLTIHATDPNSPPSSITYSLEGVDLPAGLSIDPVSGVMTWTPTESQGPQTYGINVRATKNSGARLSSAITFGITVNEVNQAPVLGNTQNVTVEEGGLVSVKITAVDADLPAQTLRYSLLAGAPAGAAIDAVSGQFTWQTPSDGAALINDISVVVTDDGPGALTDTNTFRVTLVPQFRAVINEIMYRPTVANSAYVELINPSTVRTQDLTGVILGGPRMNFAFPAGTKLLPGQIISVAQNRVAFQSAYGASLPVIGEWTGTFDRSDAWVRLYSVDAQNKTNVLDQVSFETIAPWDTAADAGAVALQLIDPTKDNSRVGNWTVAPATAQPQWQRVVQSGTASSSTMYLYLETIGDVYLDDVTLVAGSTPDIGQNFLANGDFETALTPTWTVSPNLSQSALSSTIKHSGNSSLHMITTAGGTTRASSIYQDLATPLTQGAAYTLSYWYLPNTNGGTLTLRLSGNGIKSTIDIKATNQVVPRFTPDAGNNVRAALEEFPPIWINEVLANNVNGLTDGKGEHEPWIELINTGSTPIDLTGWSLASSYANLAGWAFPAGTTVPAGGFLVVFADGQSADTTASELHTSFRLPASNGSVALVRPQATGLAVVDYVNYGTTAVDTSIASIPDGQAFHREATIATTPSAFNAVSPNRPPTIASVANQNVNVGDILNLTIAGSDPDQPVQSIAYSLDAAPQGMSIGASSGLLNWQPTGAQVGTHAVTVRVTDNGLPALSATATFNVTVIQPNRPPTIGAIADKNIKVGDVLNFTATASDPDQPQQSIVYSLDAAPQGASIGASSGIFNWQPTSAQVGTHAVTIRVTDNGSPQLFATTSFNIVVAMTNRPPTITSVANQSIKVGDLLNLTVTGSDPDQPQQSIAFSLDAAPAGASIGAASGAFSWQPNSSQVGTHAVTVRVTDTGSPQLFATTSFNITVAMTNRPPTITTVPTQNVKVGTAVNVTVSATDPDQPQQTLTYSLDTPPQGASIVAATGAFTWTPTSAQVGTNKINVRVTDNGSPQLGATTTFDVIVTMTNRPPTITTVATQNVKVGTAVNVTVSATDPDQPQQTLTYSLDTPPQGASIVAATGAFAWTPTSAQVGTNTITVRVTDNGSPQLSATTTFDVVVTEASPITITPTLDATGAPNLAWNAQSGVTYRVEYKQSLLDPDWTLLIQITATGSSASTVDSNPGQRRFYRIVAP